MRASLLSPSAAISTGLATILASIVFTAGTTPSDAAAGLSLSLPAGQPVPPIIFVHGYKAAASPGVDLPVLPKVLMQTAAAEGREVIPVGYYVKDTNGPSIQKSGKAGATFSTGKQNGGNTNGTDIRHLAYQLAWWIYDNYSSKGLPVDLVGHSLGGLITRSMLFGLNTDKSYPPTLLVEDSVTVSTPHLGLAVTTTTGIGCAASATLQCTQLGNGSSYIKELKAKGRGPQGTGGTDWTAIGASTGDVASAAVITDMGANHVVVVAKSAHTDYFKVPSSIELILAAIRSSAA